MANAIRIIFVLPKECLDDSQCSEEMQQAFMVCKQNSMNIQWVKEDNILSESWRKTDVLVFESFESPKFNEVKSKKSVRIVGPRCLLICITEGKSIPNVSWPVYNVAMYNCYVACSHLSKAQKREIEGLVQKMGGHYTGNLMEATTHLVTDTVKSEKYSKAAECGLKIMLSSWVTEVWKSSSKSNINANDSEFDKYRCPPFYNLVICCTGFSQLTERRRIEELVKKHGGTFKGQLQLSTTDILICEKGSTSSAKYKAAKKSKTLKCVSLEWLTCSIEKGYALPDHLYPVEIGTSTPTKEDNNPQPDFSMISNITTTSVLGGNTLAETLLNVASPNLATNNKNGITKETKKRKSTSNEWDDLVEQIDLKKVKMAGTFLDGCSIYLAGFSSEQKDKLCKVLNFGGAMRYDDVSERVTHAIVGDPSCHDLKLIQSSGLMNHFPLLNLHWLIDSIAQKHPVSEEQYIVNVNTVNDSEPKSPLSKKGLFALRSDTPNIKERNEIEQRQKDDQQPDIDDDSELLQQYLQPESSRQDTLAQLLRNASGTFNSESNLSKKKEEKEKSSRNEKSVHYTGTNSKHFQENSQNPLLPFDKMKFVMIDLDEEVSEDIQAKVEECGGTTVPESYKGIPNYIVMPIFLPFLKIKPSCEVVSILYILECFETKELIELEYYHRPMFIDSNVKPLSGKVVTISSYSGYERLFLRHLIEELGGESQDQFSRVTNISKNVMASTHLVSSEASGKKYEAALKWKLPVVNKDWLIKSAEKGELEPEQPYLMGDSKVDKLNNSTTVLPSTSKYSTPSKSNVKEINENTNPYISAQTPMGTPKNNTTKKPSVCDNNEVNTPVTARVFSQVTPVSKIMEEVRMTNLLGTPECPSTPKPWNHVSTPDTPLGAFIRPNPSPALRKELAQWINTLPDWKPPPPRRPSTPLSELKKQLWNKILPSNREISTQLNFRSDSGDESGKENETVATPNKMVPSSDTEETIESVMVKNQLQQIQVMLTSSGSKHSSRRRESTIPETGT
ncbi:DNA topoisomerase 2-binding protein 1 isoform X1 [Agrilus planipennis]|uniref:DNA topoisomerase 2-binding protein 1 isoform X1 n=1 Tax=Agrilus planipennis TaxID=224129 RepID=A0A7F5RI06_AGRPL|nr:DNA topoisomerase 2-binding protein 1 isoform X1 [Agrilus planipennis]